MKCAVLIALLPLIPLAGCGTMRTSATVAGASVEGEAAGLGVSGPLGALGGGVASFAVSVDPDERLAQPFIGPWTLVRSGDRVCEVDLGSRNAAGRFAAKTRRCMSIDLARIATWQPTGSGVILYDFEDRPVVTLAQGPGGAYEGPLNDGSRLTLWR